MDALTDAFDSLRLHLACVTETWYKGGKELADHITEIEGRHGIKILHRSRDGRSRKRGGGVALAFNTASCNFKRRLLRSEARDYEIICATGKIGKIDRRFVVFTVYVPPDMRAAQFESLKEALSAEITAAKTRTRS